MPIDPIVAGCVSRASDVELDGNDDAAVSGDKGWEKCASGITGAVACRSGPLRLSAETGQNFRILGVAGQADASLSKGVFRDFARGN